MTVPRDHTLPRAPLGHLNVLVVDDSAVVREVMTAVLGTDHRIQVATAADPIIAMQKMAKLQPHVIVLDLEMPRMDGLTFLRWVMSENPIPVVICSALAGKGTQIALRALQEGAVEVVAKPKLGISHFLHDSALQLIDAVWAAASARLQIRPRLPLSDPASGSAAKPAAVSLEVTTDKIIVMGASTGGTEALREILESMPTDAPGIAVVQHMPAGFTRSFAKHLDESCRVTVKEATTGDRLAPGKVLIAPGDQHLSIHRSGAQYVVSVSDGPLVSRHRPSVDVLFRSAAETAGSNAIGVILTGMGDDGASGLLEMRRSGAYTIAQNEATCVVFGMPREAIACGAVETVVPLGTIARTIMRFVAYSGSL
jgi:two-component system, chemotaxis family, protein-glutamate methylesterase/glutaminase